MKIYKDKFGNTAKIEKIKISPYKGATRKNSFRLWISADYENNLIYHVSIHETEKDVLNKLQGFSCGTFQKVK